jgi:hypothetical protein
MNAHRLLLATLCALVVDSFGAVEGMLTPRLSPDGEWIAVSYQGARLPERRNVVPLDWRASAVRFVKNQPDVFARPPQEKGGAGCGKGYSAPGDVRRDRFVNAPPATRQEPPKGSAHVVCTGSDGIFYVRD